MNLKNINCFMKFISFAILIMSYMECASVTKWSRYESKDELTTFTPQYARIRKTCQHPFTIYGKRVHRDSIVCYERVNKNAKRLTERKVQINCPSESRKSDFHITQILIEDYNTFCDCYQKFIEIKGGVGRRFANLTITSLRGCPNYHIITVFAKKIRAH